MPHPGQQPPFMRSPDRPVKLQLHTDTCLTNSKSSHLAAWQFGERKASQAVIRRKKNGSIIGAGLDELYWPSSVRPGNELRVKNAKCEALELRPSK